MVRKWLHGLIVGLLLGGVFLAVPGAQSYIWSSINGVPYAPGIRVGDGTATAPSIAFSNEPTTGFYRQTSAMITATGTVLRGNYINATSGFYNTATAGTYYWTSGPGIARNGAAGKLALLNNETAATATGFDELSLGPSTGNSASGTWALAKVHTTINMATATGTGTGTVTSATTALPAGSYVVGVSCRVTTILAGASLTTWSVGVAGNTDKWGTGLALAANTESNIANYEANAAPLYNTSAAGIVFTAAAGVFSTGVAQCTTYYQTFTNIPAV